MLPHERYQIKPESARQARTWRILDTEDNTDLILGLPTRTLAEGIKHALCLAYWAGDAACKADLASD